MATFTPDLVSGGASFNSGASGFARRPSGTVRPRFMSRLDASMWAWSFGSVASRISLGGVVVAPAGTTQLVTAVSIFTFENMYAVGALGVAGSFARASISIDEMSGTFVPFLGGQTELFKRQTSPPVTIFDSGWPALIGMKFGERHMINLAAGARTVAGKRYRIWVNLEQAAAASGIGAAAVSNCSVDFAPVSFFFA